MSAVTSSISSELLCNWSPSTRLRVPRRRTAAGLGAKYSAVKSCGNDVGDALEVELEEPVDTPGTTISTYFSVLHCIFCRSDKMYSTH